MSTMSTSRPPLATVVRRRVDMASGEWRGLRLDRRPSDRAASDWLDGAQGVASKYGIHTHRFDRSPRRQWPHARRHTLTVRTAGGLLTIGRNGVLPPSACMLPPRVDSGATAGRPELSTVVYPPHTAWPPGDDGAAADPVVLATPRSSTLDETHMLCSSPRSIRLLPSSDLARFLRSRMMSATVMSAISRRMHKNSPAHSGPVRHSPCAAWLGGVHGETDAPNAFIAHKAST